MSEVRQRIADRLMGEVMGKVWGEVLPSITPDDQLWESLAEHDRALTLALSKFERGEITYPELEATGKKYVDAWEAQAETRRPVGT